MVIEAAMLPEQEFSTVGASISDSLSKGDEATQTSTWLLDALVKDLKTKAANEGEDDVPWSKLPTHQKVTKVVTVVFRLSLLVTILYFFICALGLLEDAFKLLGGRTAGETFRNSELLSNPIAGLMIGVLATLLVQSSSTATAIVVSMVSSGVIPLETAIPIIMGTNVGTSVTSTVVAMAQAGEREEFRRAFAGATVHDMFNWSAVIVLLPLEIATGYLNHLTKAIVDSMNIQSKNYEMEMLKAVTEPFTKLIIELNKGVITDIAMSPNVTGLSSVMRRWCKVSVEQQAIPVMRYMDISSHCKEITSDSSWYPYCTEPGHDILNHGGQLFVGFNKTEFLNKTVKRERCSNLFAQTDLSDRMAGGILLIISIILILSSLFAIVKVLHSMLQGQVAKVIQKTVNADFPGRWSVLTGYAAILVGCGMTIIIQSSSVFTSTLTPLVGVGIVTVERMYPMTLGSNIGTTVTGILAAISTKGTQLSEALQIALCHLFFNISAVLIFFPIPFMRFPISLAKILGRITSKYRWFAAFYLVFMFLVIPVTIFGLSYAGWIYLATIGGPIFFIFLITILINILQVKKPEVLPKILQTWDFLPLICHSCGQIDKLITCAYCQTRQCQNKKIDSNDIESEDECEVRMISSTAVENTIV